MPSTMLKGLGMALVLAVAGAVQADDAGGSAPAHQVIRDIGKYLDHQRDLREDMEFDRKFKHVDNQSKRRFYQAQDRIFGLLEGKRSLEELDKDQLLALYTAQSEVNGVITDADLDREVCRRQKVLGSHRVQTVCMTERDRRRIHEENQSDLRRTRKCGDCEVGG